MNIETPQQKPQKQARFTVSVAAGDNWLNLTSNSSPIRQSEKEITLAQNESCLEVTETSDIDLQIKYPEFCVIQKEVIDDVSISFFD